MAWRHAVSEIVMGDRPVGPVDFTARNLVYDIACQASIMGTISGYLAAASTHSPCSLLNRFDGMVVTGSMFLF